MAIKKSTLPDPCSICIKMAGNHIAGVLLLKIFFWCQHAKATIPNLPGTWIANSTAWWMREAVLSKGQYDRNISLLAKLGLIQKRQWWFAGKKCLFVRLTPKAIVILQAKFTTWDTVEALITQIPSPGPLGPNQKKANTGVAALENDVPKTPNSKFSNEGIENGGLDAPEMMFSNNSKNGQESTEQKKIDITSVPAATDVESHQEAKQEAEENVVLKILKSKSIAISHLKSPYLHIPPAISLFDMLDTWIEAMHAKFPARTDIPAHSFSLPGTFIAALGQFYQLMFEPVGSINGFNFNAHANDFATFAVNRWDDLIEEEWSWSLENMEVDHKPKIFLDCRERIASWLYEQLYEWGKGHGLTFNDLLDAQSA